MKRWVAACAAVVLAAGIGWWWHQAAMSAPPMPDFALRDLAGHTHHPSDWRGQVLVLNFWAPWCVPCRKEIPVLKSAQKKYGPRGLQIVGMAMDHPGPVRRFVAHHHIDYPQLVSLDGVARVQDAVHGSAVLPFTLIVDRAGDIRARVTGVLTRARLVALIKPLLARKRTE